MKMHWWIFTMAFALCFVSCENKRMKSYVPIHLDGLSKIPQATQIESWVGDADHFITHFGLNADSHTWNTEVFFGGRYTLTMQVEVRIDYKNAKIGEVVSIPKFFLVETHNITQEENGQFMEHVKLDIRFDVSDWDRYWKAKDFYDLVSPRPGEGRPRKPTDDAEIKAISIDIEGEPIEYWDTIVHGWRVDRVVGEPKLDMTK